MTYTARRVVAVATAALAVAPGALLAALPAAREGQHHGFIVVDGDPDQVGTTGPRPEPAPCPAGDGPTSAGRQSSA